MSNSILAALTTLMVISSSIITGNSHSHPFHPFLSNQRAQHSQHHHRYHKRADMTHVDQLSKRSAQDSALLMKQILQTYLDHANVDKDKSSRMFFVPLTVTDLGNYDVSLSNTALYQLADTIWDPKGNGNVIGGSFSTNYYRFLVENTPSQNTSAEVMQKYTVFSFTVFHSFFFF